MRLRSSITGLVVCITVGDQTQPSPGPETFRASTSLLGILLIGSLAVQISVPMDLGVMVQCQILGCYHGTMNPASNQEPP